MKQGFYYVSDVNNEMCYYLTGKNDGNKVVSFFEIHEDKRRTIRNPKWKELVHIPDELTLKGASYHMLNPTNCVLN